MELFHSKNYFNLTEIFVYKIRAKQTDCYRLEQRSVIKFLVAKNCKPYEIYRRICDVYRELFLIFKNPLK